VRRQKGRLPHRSFPKHSPADLVSSPGSGKTAFLERTLTVLGARYSVAALVVDLATQNDAARLARSRFLSSRSSPAQFAAWRRPSVENALAGWNLHDLDFLFIENVGNLVCPSSYDLGEDLRLVLLGNGGGR
jgi:hydrogenase nickel incorporation protein HypB